MDGTTRKTMKLQIDSAMRKRMGLPERTAVKVEPRHGSRQARWTDESIELALQRVADSLGVPRAELTLAQYRNARTGNPDVGPSVNRLVPRLAAMGRSLA